MPYIKKQDREKFYTSLTIPSNCGELNFLFSDIIRLYITKKGECYQTYNDILGALEGAKLELYRRKIGNYEEQKRKDNGEVY